MAITHRILPAAIAIHAAFYSFLATAEVKEVHIAEQYGIGYLPLMVMERQRLLEKHAMAAGLGKLTVSWIKLAGGNATNDALFSNRVQFASGGVAPLITAWAQTRGKMNVKAVGALDSMPLSLVTRNPKIMTINDFTDRDRIALPAAKVSIQAVTLQMAAAKSFGEKNYNRLDRLTVSMAHPDGMAALLSGKPGIDAHFTAPPFQEEELQNPAVHEVINSFQVLGGPATFNLVWTTSSFHDVNPKTYNAFVAALEEAVSIVNRDAHAAAVLYKEISGDKAPVALVEQIIKDPFIRFTLIPQSIYKYTDFMYKTGAIKVKPSSWKELFFPNAHVLPGS